MIGFVARWLATWFFGYWTFRVYLWVHGHGVIVPVLGMVSLATSIAWLVRDMREDREKLREMWRR